MADIYGSHFEFSGVSSRQYGLVIANVETSRNTQLSGAKEGVTIFSKSAKKRYLIDDDYTNSPISLEVEIINEEGRCLEYIERRQIEKWLFNHRTYRKLYIDIMDDVYGETYEIINDKQYRNYLNCRLINPQKVEGNGGIIGYKATLEADSDMFWQDAITQTFSVNNGAADISTVITVNVDTDLDEYIYPKVKITLGSVGGDIIIANNSDDSTRLTKFVGIGAHASIIMKGELNYINGDYYEKFANRNFIRLLDGENKLLMLGDIDSVEFEYSARRLM